MKPAELIEAFNKRTIDIPIFDAVLKQGDEIIAQGYARLYADSGGDFVLHVYGTQLKRLKKSSKRRTIPRSLEIAFTGRWEDRWSVNAETAVVTDLQIKPTGYDNEFRIHPNTVTFTRHTAGKTYKFKPYVEATLDYIDEFIWEGVTEVEKRRNGRTVGNGWSRDTLDWTVDKFEIQVLKGNEIGSSISAHKHKRTSIASLERVLTSGVRALSLRLGRQIEVLSSFAESTGVEVVKLNCRNKTRLLHKQSLPPVRNLSGEWSESKFVQLATTFFLIPENEPLSWYLRYFWDAEFTSWETRELCLGVAIELLAGFILSDWAKANKPKHRALKTKETLEFEQAKLAILLVLDQSTIDFKKTPYNRFYGSVKTMGFSNSREKLKAAGEVLGLTVTKKQTEAWSRMRNQSAHRKKKRPSFSIRINDWMCCLSLFHRFALGLIRWQGKYNNYAKVDNPVEPLYPNRSKISKL